MENINTINTTARMTAFYYFLMGIFSGYSMGYLDPIFHIPDDTVTTAHNILASEGLFRFGMVSSIIAQIFFLFTVYGLYRIFKSVDRHYAKLMIILVMVSVPITCLNLLNQFAALLILSGPSYMSVSGYPQTQTLALLFLDIYAHGVFIAEIFWGLWLFPLGILIYRSGFIPKIFGILFMLGCFGYLITSIVAFLFPGYESITLPGLAISAFAEISFILWVLVKGVNIEEYKNHISKCSDKISNI